MKEGWALWVTGLPASGKSSLTQALVKKLNDLEVKVEVLESDNVREVLTPKPTYSSEERDRFYKSLVYIGELLTRNGVNVIFDATANKSKWRIATRENIPRFMEVFVDTPLEVCKMRDPKGIYEAAEKGEAKHVPGEQEAYERPERPEVRVDGTKSPNINALKVLEVMKKHGYV
jgi:adenylylsulfate kinase